VSREVVIAGGGAAGFFAAIACAEADPRAQVTLYEKGRQCLAKVRISGGGRCNVTHRCFDPRELATRYPRGARALIGPFTRFGPGDTIDWFARRGVELKVESDGRLFPITDSSETIVDCLMRAADDAGVRIIYGRGVSGASRSAGGRLHLSLTSGEGIECDRFLLATGGIRATEAVRPALDLGHRIEPPVPSLFTFNIGEDWLRDLSGVSAEVEASIVDSKLRGRGPLLITHWGASGPVILRLSAWGARELHGRDYRFTLRVNWLPALTTDTLDKLCDEHRRNSPGRLVANTPFPPLPSRLWEGLVLSAGIPREARWARFGRPEQRRLVDRLNGTLLPVTGKSTNKEEFVTCGGIRLSEVDFKTMGSRICPGLHFAGEVLDVDGITGGFNFQAAWTTGWLAGRAMAGQAPR